MRISKLGQTLRTTAMLAAGLAVLGVSAPASSQDDFYARNDLTVHIGFSTGGAYDLYGRLVARHIGRHLPGQPTVIASNMPGAGGLRLANWLATVGPRDGTAIGLFSRGIPFEPLLGDSGAVEFDVNAFNWIGSPSAEVSLCVVRSGAPVQGFEQLFDETLIVGGTGSTADTAFYPRAMNGILGTQFEIISGYPGGGDVNLAMMRGEVDGRCGWSWSSLKATDSDTLERGEISLLVQLSLQGQPGLEHVPLIMDFARDDTEERMLRLIFARQQIGFPFVAPPGIPAERLEELRSAFAATLTDEAFIAEATRAGLDLQLVTHDEIADLIADSYDQPPEIIDELRRLIDGR